MGKSLLKALNGVRVYGCFISLLSILCVVFWSFEFSLAEFAVCGISLWGGDPCDNTEGIWLGVVLVMMAILPIILFIIGIGA